MPGVGHSVGRIDFAVNLTQLTKCPRVSIQNRAPPPALTNGLAVIIAVN